MLTEKEIDWEDTQIGYAHKSIGYLLRAYLIFSMMNWSFIVKWTTFLIKFLLHIKFPFIKTVVKHTLFAHFCGGESLSQTEKIITQLASFKIGIITDYSVEGMKKENEFDHAEKEILATISYASQHLHVPFCVFKVTTFISPDFFKKLERKEKFTEKENRILQQLKQRVERICNSAFEYGVRVLIDAEETWIQKIIDELAYEMMEKFNRKKIIIYNTYQMYIISKYEELCQALEKAKNRGYKIGVKIVRGAYMEKEIKRSLEFGYPNPIQPNKKACDQAYNKTLKFCVENRSHIALCAGTHNEESCSLLINLMKKANIPSDDLRFFFMQLYGMGDQISYNLSTRGYNVAKYLPYGPIHLVLPYLFRRAEENTSVAGQSNREFRQIHNELKRRLSI